MRGFWLLVAAVAGGKKELREAAKRVREAKVKPKVEIAVDQPDDTTPAEAGEVKQWLVGIAQRTAQAAKEGAVV